MAVNDTVHRKGIPGRSKKVLPTPKRGGLGVDFSKSSKQRHKIEIALAKKKGEKSVMGKLQLLANLTKRTNPILSKKATADKRFIAASFIGKKRVKTGTGLTRR